MPARRGDFQPIADYGLLADCTSAALVDSSGSIDWLCLPRYDSPAVFSRLLDPAAGHWSITPTGDFGVERRYLPGSLVIETTFRTATGVARLTDALAFPPGQRGHDLGRDAPHQRPRLRRPRRAGALGLGGGRGGGGRAALRARAASGVRAGQAAVPPRGPRR